jgi:hypothetical protein
MSQAQAQPKLETNNRLPSIMGPIIPTAQTTQSPSFQSFSVNIFTSDVRNVVDRMFGSSDTKKNNPCETFVQKYDICLLKRSSFECQEYWNDVKKCIAEK